MLIGETICAFIVLCLGNTYVAQMYSIPSESMESTIDVGDRVVVDKTGLADVKRGDVVVFRDDAHWEGESHPNAVGSFLASVGINDHGNHLIKRVIGLPGDTVSCTFGSNIVVNGTEVNETYLKRGTVPCNKEFKARLGANHVWVMGDNRMVSYDSRFNGPIASKSILGVCKVTTWPLNRIGGCGNHTDVFSKVKKS